MSRKTTRPQVGVALFPFLAVLICTMGALIVLLVLLVQQARVDAKTIAAAQIGGKPEANKQQLRERLEDAQWQRELLEKSRAEKTEELANARARLAHLEEHTQRLEAQARELLNRAKSIDEGKKLRNEDLAAARSEVARLKAEIERKQRELEEAKKKSGEGQEWYALIPYDGRSGTRRRPIYVECTEFGVIVQPEGLLLKAEDFNGPLGPGNPLDMALRAIREHIEKTAGTKAGQPYPLLVVRPSGVVAFGAARAAIKAWDDEWGYELISDEKQLDFGPPDPALSAVLSKTVAVARQRQAAMIAMMPRHFQEEEPLKSFAHEPTANNTDSGYVGAGGGIGGGTGTGRSGVAGTGYGQGGVSGVGGGLPGATGSGQGGTSANGGKGTTGANGGTGSGGSGIPSVTGSLTGAQGSGPGIASATSTSAGGAGGGSFPGSPIAGSGMNDGSRGTGSGSGGQQGAGSSAGTSGTQSLAGSGQSGRSGSARGGQSGGQSGELGGGSAAGGGGSAAAGSSSPAGGSSFGAGSSMPPGSMGTVGVPSFNLGAQKTASSSSGGSQSNGSSGSPRSTAKRGNNWALPQAKPNQIGVTRPIRISVQPDRVVMVPERGDSRQPKVVPVAPELTPDDVTNFVTAVQGEVKGWGLAVSEGYWKPVLQAEVAPGAERHFLNLETALRGSGIDIVRR